VLRKSNQAVRAISTGQLCRGQPRPRVTTLTLPAYQPGGLPGPLSSRWMGKPHLGEGFALRCFQRLSRPNIATQRVPLAGQLVHQRFVHPGPLVLGAAPLKLPTPTADRDRTVSRRSEPSSRTSFNGRTARPLGPASAPGCDEPTSRCQASPSLWALGGD